MPTITPRALALTTLLSVSRGRYANITVDATLRRAALSDADRSLYTALVYGVIERQVTLDDLIARYSARPVHELDDTVLMALRMGIYQLAYLDRIPDHAALDETVALVPRRASGYVNAVLRAYLRAEKQIGVERTPREGALKTVGDWIRRYPDLANDPERALSVATGVPSALCRVFSDALGADRASNVLMALGDPPPITVRINPRRTTLEAVTAELTASGLTVTPGLYAPHALRVTGGSVAATDAFQDGRLFVQDEASQLCVAALSARPGDITVDTCACPGSKSFGMALDMDDCGEVYAFDLHKSKLSLIESGADRLGLSVLRVGERDARTPDPTLLGRCDRVLCDVPCSGLGVIAKKPEIRHKDLAESARLPAIQAAILDASAGYVKPGGVLVYSTCTILPAENEAVVTAFLAVHPEFRPLDFVFPAKDPSVPDIRSEGGMVTLFPAPHKTDGFFIARIVREG